MSEEYLDVFSELGGDAERLAFELVKRQVYSRGKLDRLEAASSALDRRRHHQICVRFSGLTI